MEAEPERLEASSVHVAHEYRVQEADLVDEVEASWRGWRSLLFMLLMSTVFRRLT